MDSTKITISHSGIGLADFAQIQTRLELANNRRVCELSMMQWTSYTLAPFFYAQKLIKKSFENFRTSTENVC